MMLLKAFKKESWANAFLDGDLYCNTLSFHRRVDNQEGAVVITGASLDKYKFEVGTHELKTVSCFTYRPNMADHINVFCMYSWTPPFEDSSKKRVILNKETQLGSLRTLEDTYGPFSVLIRDLPEFFRRLTTAIERPDSQVYCAEGNAVKYELMDRIPRSMEDMIQLAFRKSPKYADEKEYRFMIVPDREESGPLKLSIGSIRDIAGLTRTRELYDTITINGSADF